MGQHRPNPWDGTTPLSVDLRRSAGRRSFPLSDTVEPGPLAIVGLDASRGQEPVEHPPRDPDNAAVLADFDPELGG
jgi:hypothetical protein